MTFALLVMTLNEIEGMKCVMPKIDNDWIDELLVVDGGSTDGTVEWARKNGYRVHLQRQKGIRHGYIEALEVVKSDYVIIFSPDGNSVPENIRPTKLHSVGLYAIQFSWTDGHDTGLYSHDLMRKLCQCVACQ